MRKPSWLFDTRNITNYKKAAENGINIWLLGSNANNGGIGYWVGQDILELI